MEFARRSRRSRRNDVMARCSEPPFPTRGGQDDGSYTNSLKLLCVSFFCCCCFSHCVPFPFFVLICVPVLRVVIDVLYVFSCGSFLLSYFSFLFLLVLLLSCFSSFCLASSACCTIFRGHDPEDDARRTQDP